MQFYHLAKEFDHLLLQLVGSVILQTLSKKYGVSYRQLLFIIKTSELLMKSCAKFDFLFVNIQCVTACSLEKVNYKV